MRAETVTACVSVGRSICWPVEYGAAVQLKSDACVNAAFDTCFYVVKMKTGSEECWSNGAKRNLQ